MHKDIVNVMSQLSVGQFSDPICLQGGCYVFELIHKQFMDVNNKKVKTIREQLFQQRLASKNEKLDRKQKKAIYYKKIYMMQIHITTGSLHGIGLEISVKSLLKIKTKTKYSICFMEKFFYSFFFRPYTASVNPNILHKTVL